MTYTSLTVYPMSWSAALPANRGVHPVWVAATLSEGNRFTCTGKETVLLRSANAAVVTVTLKSNACDQGHTTEHDFTMTIPIGSVTEQFAEIPEVAKSQFASTVDTVANQVRVQFSSITGVQVAITQRT